MQAVEHIGKRIRLYRKQKKMTIDALSAKLHLSPSTISKYENGKIAMDVTTLFYIASVLDININQLVDYTEPTEKKITQDDTSQFLKRSNYFYLYTYLSVHNKIGISVIEIVPNNDSYTENKVIMYYRCDNENNFTKCTRLLNGNISYTDKCAYICLHCIINESERGMLIINNSSSNRTTGVLTAISKTLDKPYSTIAIVSSEPLDHAQLKKELKLSSKDLIASIKANNALISE